MNLVSISKNVLVNPEKITSIELKNVKGRIDILVLVEGRQYSVEKDVSVFLRELKASGVEAPEQFWAG